MAEVQWYCLMCEEENTSIVNMKDFDGETTIDSKCSQCDSLTELSVKSKPYVDWMDLK